ncbi:MAG: ATP-binding protein [Armatimonadota bacterium]
MKISFGKLPFPRLRRAARPRWPMQVAHCLRVIASGSGAWREWLAGNADLDEVDPELREAIEHLGECVRTLRREKRQSRMVLESMADGIIALDAKGQITLCNAAACRICGVRDMLAVGMRLEDTEVHPEVSRLAHECVLEKKAFRSEIKLPGWPQRVVSIRAAWYAEAHSGADSAIVIFHDLTEVRRHEMSQKEFVANVSHELKTPITAVRTTAEALLAGAKNDEDFVDRFLNTIISESDRLSLLIEDLLEIARRDSGITKTEKLDCSVAEIVSRALKVVYPQAAQKSVAVETNVPEALVGFCDEAQAVQLVQNLVDNAVKYTLDGGRVEVSACEVDSNLVLSVKDTGIGIPHGEADRVFERFYRVDKARSRRLGGTGLGLAIVKDIVESHGGEIRLDTQLGKGSTFTVTLPGRTAEDAPA